MGLTVGQILEGKVKGITAFGAFVELPDKQTGMVHISEVAPTYVKEIRDHLTEGQDVKVKIIGITNGKVSLSIKKAMDPPARGARPAAVSPGRPGAFEWPAGGRQGSRSSGSAGNAAGSQAGAAAGGAFEDMMSKFKQSSDEKILDLKRSVDGKHGGFSRRGR
ncbi:MAG: S1 RNA-binding domain-containing protein [Oscillospiraceae bacterium]|nr:S1 RNA-binding domain-containing protein [Oscillospiraceae bacterium]